MKLHIKEMEKPTLVIAWNQIPKRKTIVTNLSQMCYVHTPIVLEVFFHYVLTMLMVYINKVEKVVEYQGKRNDLFELHRFLLAHLPM